VGLVVGCVVRYVGWIIDTRDCGKITVVKKQVQL